MRCTYSLLLLFIYGSLHAQSGLNTTSNFDVVQAKQNEITLQTENLKGKVKAIHMVSIQKRDSTILKYSASGKLTYKHYFKDSSDRFDKYTYAYKYDSLIGISITYGRPQENDALASQIKQFKNGHLSRAVNNYIHPNQTNKFAKGGIKRIMIKYTYNEDFSEASIDYTYSGDNLDIKDRWLPRFGKLSFKYDTLHRVVWERSLTDYGESTHAGNATYRYEANNNCSIHIKYKSDCAGHNSCLDYDVSVNYDTNGRVTKESLSDHTIRNSLWSYSYLKKIRYNTHGDTVATSLMEDPDGALHLIASSIAQHPVTDQFRYDYDDTGNWVRKWAINPSGDRLICSRQISYY